MAAEGGRIDFMFLGPPYPAAGSATAFTVPPGGAGLYFFYISFKQESQEFSSLSITKNGGEACRASMDFNNAGNDGGMISCGTLQLVAEGIDLSSSVF